MGDVLDFPVMDADTTYTTIEACEAAGCGRRIVLSEGRHKKNGMLTYAVLMEAPSGESEEPFDIIIEMVQDKTSIEAMTLLAKVAERTLRMTAWVGASEAVE